MQYRFIDAISDIPALCWNAIAGSDYPFLRHEFLQALETSGSVGGKSGWQPHHLLIENDDKLIALLPLYIKTHSYGEYVFDWSWADAFHRHGYSYYPKLLSAIPFTPATGPRLAYRCDEPSALIDTVNQALQQEVEKLGASSWHLLFPEEQALSELTAMDADLRVGCQYHWQNHDYQSFDDFLQRFSSRKRKTLRKERQRVVDQGIRLQRLNGTEIGSSDIHFFYRCYQSTYAKRSGHGGYLSEAFFQQLLDQMPKQLMLVVAYEEEKPIASALYLLGRDTLYGRYWGCIKERDGLHFEACYYQGIEFAIELGLQTFDAGAQGEHKIQRGFEPTLTWSLHWVQHPAFRSAIQEFLLQERQAIEEYRQDASGNLPFKKEA